MNKKIRLGVLTVLFVGLVIWSLAVRPAARTDTGISKSGLTVVRAEDVTSGAAITGGATTTPVPTSGAAATATPTPSPTPNPAVKGIKESLVLYKSEEISVEVDKSNTQVYYCVLKKNTDTGAKQADMLPAASNEYGSKYYIDISTLSASKDCYVGVCTDLTPDATGLVPVICVPVRANQKKITFNVDWSYEGSPSSFSGKLVLESVDITTNDSKNISYKHLTGAETELVKDIDREDFRVQWRKGANGSWRTIESMTYSDWESMKNSGAIIYFRLDAENQSYKDAGQRYSKENKVKVAITKASAVKVDVSKLTVSIKNGMQFRVHGAADGRWYTILPYASQSTNATYLRDKTLATLFDPFSESTSAKVTVTSIKDIKNAISYIEPATPTALVLDVRIAATTKKPASRVGTVTIPSQAAKPVVGAMTKSGDSYTMGTITAADTLVASPAFEYTVVSKADADAGLIDFTTLKWSTIKAGTNLKNNLRGTYNILDAAHTRRTIGIGEANACLLVRRRGVNGSSKVSPILASDVAIVAVPAN